MHKIRPKSLETSEIRPLLIFSVCD